MSSALNLANILTITRLLIVPFFVISVYYGEYTWALGLFVGAALTDGLDGFVARAFNQKTQLGTILDPMADKLLRQSSCGAYHPCELLSCGAGFEGHV